MTLIFDPSRSSKVKGDGANRKPVGPTSKRFLGSNLVSVTVFEIFLVKILTVHLLTLVGLTRAKGHRKGDDLLSTYIYHPTKFQPDRANDVRDMRYQFFQSLALICDPSRSSKVKFDDANRKPVGPRYNIRAPWGPTSYLSQFSRYFESKF